MSWIIKRRNYETNDTDYLIDDNQNIAGRKFLLGEADDLEWDCWSKDNEAFANGTRLYRQFPECGDAYSFIADYVRTAKRRKLFWVYEDYGYLPVYHE